MNQVFELIQKGSYSEALTLIEKSLKNNPEDWYAYYLQGICLRQQGNYQEAINSYKKSLSLKEDSATLLALGIVCQLDKRYEEAKEAFQKAIELNPTLFTAYNSLGLTYRLSGEPAKALETYFSGQIKLFVDIHKFIIKNFNREQFWFGPLRDGEWSWKAITVLRESAPHEGITLKDFPNEEQEKKYLSDKSADALFILSDDKEGDFHSLEVYLDVFHKALSSSTLYSTLMHNIAVVFDMNGSRESAVEHYKEAIDFIPSGQTYSLPVNNLNSLIMNYRKNSEGFSQEKLQQMELREIKRLLSL
jgi:tetratricopeptide (TPR) repeat protein